MNVPDGNTDTTPHFAFVCDICLDCHTTQSCPLLQSGIRVKDTEVLPKALASLPLILQLQKVQPGEHYKIVAAEIISEGTQFGPLEAPIGREQDSCSETNSAYKVSGGKRTNEKSYLDLSDPTRCNWMSLIDPLQKTSATSNCIAFQQDGEIHFLVTKEIEIGTELVVSYAPGYRNFMDNIDQSHELDLETAIPASFSGENKRTLKRKSLEPHATERASEESSLQQNFMELKKARIAFSQQEVGIDFFHEKLKCLGPCLAVDDWKCKFCTEVFSKIPDFASHLISHYKLVVGATRSENDRRDSTRVGNDTKNIDTFPRFPYSCDICERKKTFNRAEYLIRHLNKHALHFRCKSCKTISRGTSHNCSSGPLRKFECSDCGKQVGSEFSLDRHITLKHKNTEQENLNTLPVSPSSHPESQEMKSFDSFSVTENSPLRHPEEVLEVREIITLENYGDSTIESDSNLESTTTSCCICHKEIRQKNYDIHLLICENIKNFRSGLNSSLECKLCADLGPCADIEEFRTHMGYHTHPLSCPGCQLRLISHEALKSHKCTEFSCDGCGNVVFDSLTNLQNHIETIHSRADYYCFECAYPFVTQEGYLNHSGCVRARDHADLKVQNVNKRQLSKKRGLRRQRPSEQKREGQDGNFVCEMCGVHYTKFSSLKTHRLTHGPRKHECPTCGKQFHRQTLLAEHLFVHLPPQFECTECGKKLKTPKALEVHFRIHTGIKNYTCDFVGCDKAFCQKGNLVAHRLTHVPLDEKDFQCPYCSKRLATRESCNIHVKAHEEKPFSCHICAKEFVSAALVRRHQIVAHGSQRYSCSFCPLIVKQKPTFLRHLRHKHEEFRDVWMQQDHLESRLRVLGSSGSSKGTRSRQATIVVEVATTEVHDDNRLITSEELEKESQVLEEFEIEYQNEELMMPCGAEAVDGHGSELELLQLNQDDEFAMSLGTEEPELVDGDEFVNTDYSDLEELEKSTQKIL